MAFNNVFPIGYQPAQVYYPQQYQMQPTQMSGASQSGLIWVQGEAGAKSYFVAPNNTVQLWDSENQTIYLKSADASGMPSMKILDYKIRDLSPVNAPVSPSVVEPSYATKADLQALYGRVEVLQSELEGLRATKPKKEAKNNEQPAV